MLKIGNPTLVTTPGSGNVEYQLAMEGHTPSDIQREMYRPPHWCVWGGLSGIYWERLE